MSVDSGWTTEAALAAFDDHLRRARGLCAGTRVNYARWVRAFLDERYPDGRVQVEELGARDVIEFIGAASRRYQPKTLELAASSLRSFFRFLRGQGLGAEGLEDAVPMVPHRRNGLVRHLDSRAFSELIASLGTSSARDLRDRAIIVCMARLGLRVSEVCQLRLDDVDWREGVISVRTRKTGHGARLPITDEVGRALAEYLEHGRPDTSAREVFVLMRQRPGARSARASWDERCRGRLNGPGSTRRRVVGTCCAIQWPRSSRPKASVWSRSPICSGTAASPPPGSTQQSTSTPSARWHFRGPGGCHDPVRCRTGRQLHRRASWSRLPLSDPRAFVTRIRSTPRGARGSDPAREDAGVGHLDVIDRSAQSSTAAGPSQGPAASLPCDRRRDGRARSRAARPDGAPQPALRVLRRRDRRPVGRDCPAGPRRRPAAPLLRHPVRVAGL